jgi:hypothetical protein
MAAVDACELPPSRSPIFTPIELGAMPSLRVSTPPGSVSCLRV